jgi:hypothetical protein
MRNLRPTGPNDEAWKAEGDAEFLGVDERIAAALLPAGMVARAVNMRFRNKRAEPRNGDQICLWSWAGGQVFYQEVYCCAQFANPDDGLEWVVVAGKIGGSAGIWALRPNNEGKALTVTLPSGAGALSAATCVQFVQCMNVLVLLRGKDEAPLVCTSLDEGFKGIAQSASGTGTVAIPNSGFGLYYKNRLLVVSGRDEVAVSDALDYTRYVPVLSEFKINKGNNDALVAMAALTDSTVVMLKDQSVLRVDNVYGDLSSVRLGEVTNEYGCVSAWSVVRMGTDLAWLSEKGIVTLKLTELNQIQSTQEILSAPMEKTVGRINWAYAGGANGGSGACAAYWDGKLYMAVPLDDAELLGANLVASGASYNGSGAGVSVGLTAGLTYRYAQGANDSYAAETPSGNTYRGDCSFVATDTTLNLVGTASATVTATVREVVFKGVNNAVLVYDTVTRTWQGYDTRNPSDTRLQMNVHRWVMFTYQDKLRLGYFDRYGYMRLYEEGVQDEYPVTVGTLYVDVIVQTSTPGTGVGLGETIRVNSGTNVFADSTLSVNVGTSWGTSTEANAQNNLYTGFNTGGWTAANTTVSQLAGGLRFLSTNGLLPDVKINGTSVTALGYYGTSSWALVDPHQGGEFTPAAIETELVTRAYWLGEPTSKRFRELLLNVSTWAPNYTVKAVGDGFAEETTYVNGQTRSQTVYDSGSGGVADAWVETNENNDWETRGRQDYSVVPDNVTGTSLGSGEGINFDQVQEQSHRMAVNEDATWMQLKVTNTAGRVAVESAWVGGKSGERKLAVRAG